MKFQPLFIIFYALSLLKSSSLQNTLNPTYLVIYKHKSAKLSDKKAEKNQTKV